jgi:uncharacterized membrane protein
VPPQLVWHGIGVLVRVGAAVVRVAVGPVPGVLVRVGVGAVPVRILNDDMVSLQADPTKEVSAEKVHTVPPKLPFE